ncbi:MAG: hypothetical protein Q8O85_02750 [Rhodoferax sp.]|nr:hypothetical protein [Rhodoferax sp.]MDP2677631.1 hypothetical protein [Rhodoferax sp.]OGB39756.1 MAG: hypothetical protein A2461_00845 [Burkholderiales bacterium RIFOXYC2_FULL_59_8]
MRHGPDAAVPSGDHGAFCHNHGLLQITNRPQWWTVQGGAGQYVEKITNTILALALLATPNPLEQNTWAPFRTQPNRGDPPEGAQWGADAV